VIVGHGDKHLIGITTARAPPAAGDANPADRDSWIATANHPIWVEGVGWTDTDDLAVGDLLEGVTGEHRVVTTVADHGWQAGQTVHNLSIANVHTFMVGSVDAATLVHNSSPECLIAAAVGPGPHARGFVRGTAGRIGSAAQALVNKLGSKHGCHTCGAKSPGTKSGNWVGDHWPPRAMKAWFPNVKFTFRPQCLPCSKSQGGKIRALITRFGRGPR
jgi:hypothetical protein